MDASESSEAISTKAIDAAIAVSLGLEPNAELYSIKAKLAHVVYSEGPSRVNTKKMQLVGCASGVDQVMVGERIQELLK